MAVQDDGRGIPDDLDEAEGLGLRTLRCRANLIGPTLSLEAGTDAPGNDTGRLGGRVEVNGGLQHRDDS